MCVTPKGTFAAGGDADVGRWEIGRKTAVGEASMFSRIHLDTAVREADEHPITTMSGGAVS